jgi:hypothetical protein
VIWLPAAMSAVTWGGAPAGAIARPSGPTLAVAVTAGVPAGTVVLAGAVLVAVGTGVPWDACACAAVPPRGELGYDVPPVVCA